MSTRQLPSASAGFPQFVWPKFWRHTPSSRMSTNPSPLKSPGRRVGVAVGVTVGVGVAVVVLLAVAVTVAVGVAVGAWISVLRVARLFISVGSTLEPPGKTDPTLVIVWCRWACRPRAG